VDRDDVAEVHHGANVNSFDQTGPKQLGKMSARTSRLPTLGHISARMTEENTEIFDCLNSLKVASTGLMPPFKTVKMSNSPLSSKFTDKQSVKVFSQSTNLAVSLGPTSGLPSAYCGIREIISQEGVIKLEQWPEHTKQRPTEATADKQAATLRPED
jgi:hypothetical protein